MRISPASFILIAAPPAKNRDRPPHGFCFKASINSSNFPVTVLRSLALMESMKLAPTGLMLSGFRVVAES
jgi:hypothetical protein